ncbi:MAG: DUF58 domain-containing protein [Candidatus Sumerlaeota bacterium]|nr:DUF58 domain-containing protein [Candidatus Sumerlaeota bacterium]
MNTRDILKKVRRIEIMTNRMVNEIMAGEYHSVFKGRGMEFDEVREYQPGDDVRLIDWNVTARTGAPHVKRYVEERELTVMLAVDASSSSQFGSREKMKGETAAEICAVLAFSAIKNNDQVGLMIFTDTVEKFIPPKKGSKHVLRVIRELIGYEPQSHKTDIAGALEHLNRVLRRKSVVFLVSDFLTGDLERPLSIANRRHDLIAVPIVDPRELELPSIGFLELEDAETGETILIDTRSAGFRREFSSRSRGEQQGLSEMLKRLRIDAIHVQTGEDYIQPMVRLFRQRAKRY